MTHPRELWEDTLLNDPYYPVNLFQARIPDAKYDQSIFNLHWHEHFEIIFMLRGKAIFHIDNRPCEAIPGDILLVPSGSLHVGYSLCDGPIEIAAIVFNAALFSGFAQDPVHAHFVAPFWDGRAAYPVKLDSLLDSNEELRSLLHQILLEFKEQKPAYQLAVKARLHLLLLSLARNFMPHKLKNASSKPFISNLDRFKDLIRKMEAGYGEKWTIDLAARHVNMSSFHFCKTFKKLTGRTFVDYLNMARMNEAEQLLLNSDLTVTEISEKVGCGNPNYLTKLYKRYKGIAPSQARKEV